MAVKKVHSEHSTAVVQLSQGTPCTLTRRFQSSRGPWDCSPSPGPHLPVSGSLCFTPNLHITPNSALSTGLLGCRAGASPALASLIREKAHQGPEKQSSLELCSSPQWQLYTSSNVKTLPGHQDCGSRGKCSTIISRRKPLFNSRIQSQGFHFLPTAHTALEMIKPMALPIPGKPATELHHWKSNPGQGTAHA